MSASPAKIDGYRTLSSLDVILINDLKATGQRLMDAYDRLEGSIPGRVDKRWLAIAKTDLQTSVMAAVRAVAQPEGI